MTAHPGQPELLRERLLVVFLVFFLVISMVVLLELLIHRDEVSCSHNGRLLGKTGTCALASGQGAWVPTTHSLETGDIHGCAHGW